MGVPAYGELTLGAIRKELGFSAGAGEALARDYSQLRQGDWRTAGKTQGPTPEQWKRVRSDFQRQVAGVLTPQQVAALKEIRLRNVIPSLAQKYEPGEIGKQLGVTEEQRVRLRRIAGEYDQGVSSAERAAQERSLAVPTRRSSRNCARNWTGSGPGSGSRPRTAVGPPAGTRRPSLEELERPEVMIAEAKTRSKGPRKKR